MAMGNEDLSFQAQANKDPERYGDEEKINSGGLKDIYKVMDRSTRRYVALAKPRNLSNAEQKEHFLREAYLTASLEHPNIMPVYDSGLIENYTPFFTMKLMKGETLQGIIDQKADNWKEWSLIQRLSLFIQITEAIAYSHSKQIVHLDLKPENIQLGEFGEVLVCDWGLGKILYEEESSLKNDVDPGLYNDMTLDGELKGTPGYMAPEQADPTRGERDARTDIYALGGILYCMMTGEKPVQGSDLETIMKNTLAGELMDVKIQEKALNSVILKALETNPQARYESVLELQNDLQAFIQGFATSAEEADLSRLLWLFVRRNFRLIISLSTLVSFGFFWLYSSQKQGKLQDLYSNEKEVNQQIKSMAVGQLLDYTKETLKTFQFDQTENILKAALAMEDQNALAWNALGELKFYRQEFEEATECFNKASDSVHDYLSEKIKI